jgi:hypothetical protein
VTAAPRSSATGFEATVLVAEQAETARSIKISANSFITMTLCG